MECSCSLLIWSEESVYLLSDMILYTELRGDSTHCYVSHYAVPILLQIEESVVKN